MMSESLSHPNNTSNDFNTVEIYCVAKGYHECTFQVEIGERFVAMQKNSTKGIACEQAHLIGKGGGAAIAGRRSRREEWGEEK